MKQILILFAVFLSLIFSACNSQETKVVAENNESNSLSKNTFETNKTPVLVELFTSEG